MFETSMLMARRHKLEALARKGRRGARGALRVLEDVDSMLATILLCNNFANVVVASLATYLAVMLFGEGELVLSATSVATTLVILVIAEITPKALGVRFAEQIACFASPLLQVLVKIAPLGRFMRWVLARVGSLTGRDDDKQAQDTRSRVASAELLALIRDKDTLVDAGAEQKAMLSRLVGLHETDIRDLMSGRSEIQCLDIDEPLDKLRGQMQDSKYQQLPLCKDGLDNTMGLLSTQELLAADSRRQVTKDDMQTLAKKPLYFPDTIDPVKALTELYSHGQRAGLVVDEYGGLVGMITLGDFSEHVFAAFESKDAGPRPKTSFVEVAGDELVREINLHHDFQLPEDQARTIGGLIVDELDSFPERAGLSLRIADVLIEIRELDGRNIALVRLTRAAPQSQQQPADSD